MESFELVTLKSKRRIPFEEKDGAILGWQDEVQHRLNEHVILGRDGVVHQSQSQGPRKFVFKILNREPGASERYRTTERLLGAEPFCKLIHPRYSQVSVVFLGLKALEDPDTQSNAQILELSLSETGLREVAAESAGSAAREAAAASQQLRTDAAPYTRLVAPALALDNAVLGYLRVAENEALGLYDLTAALKQVNDTAGAFVSLAGVDVARARLVAGARLAQGKCLQSYQLLGVARPPMLLLEPLEAQMSLARLARRLYGGGAVAMEAEIARLNRIANPFALPAGTRYLVPDPLRVVLE